MEPSKNILQSKTLWINLAVALLPLVSQEVQTVIATHPAAAPTVFAVLNILNRVFGTSQPVNVLPKP